MTRPSSELAAIVTAYLSERHVAVAPAGDRPTWDEYFLSIARAVATRADCTRSRHGAVIVKNNRVISTGYNGSPPGGGSCLKGECPRGRKDYTEAPSNVGGYSDCIALHCEQNAISFGNYEQMQGGTIYIAGGKPPCSMCEKLITAAGLVRCVWE